MKMLYTLALFISGVSPAFPAADVSVTTSTYDGTFAPDNCCAVWVEKDDGTYVRTLGAWAGSRYVWYLFGWTAKAPDTDINATTGATRRSHGTITRTWDLADTSGTAVAYGTYNVIIEMTEDNARGKTDTLPLLVDGTARTATTTDQAPFSGFSAAYEPDDAAVRRPPAFRATVETVPLLPAVIRSGMRLRLPEKAAAPPYLDLVAVDGSVTVRLRVTPSRAVTVPPGTAAGMYAVDTGAAVFRVIITR